jgi:zinc protease
MAEVRKRFTGQGPILTVVSPKPIEGGEGAVAAAYDAAHREQLAAPTPLVKMPWPYTDFGKPGLVVSRESIPEFDATRVVFANGTTLLVKKTNFETDSVVT